MNPINENLPIEKFCYKYPHAALTADCVIFGFNGSDMKVLLVERAQEPYKGMWALPGGFMRMDEAIEQTARRELREETNLTNVYLEQFRVYSDVNRDPRERVVTVAFIALVRPEDYEILAGDDASNAMWFDDRFLPPMAFDHDIIIREAREHLAEILRIKPVAFELLNKYFSLSELQKVYEVINRTNYDRRNFQRKAIQTGFLEEIDIEPVGYACESESPYNRPQQRSQSGRPLRKLFSFKRHNKSNDSDDSEGSTKDLFDSWS